MIRRTMRFPPPLRALPLLLLLALDKTTHARDNNNNDDDKAAFDLACDREPRAHDSPKTPGDNGFRLIVHTYPDAYIPDRTYTVSLLGQNNGDYVQSFRGFMIVSLAAEDAGQPPLRGKLQTIPRFGFSQRSTDPVCPASIVHTTTREKTRVDVKWTAPPTGSGCVLLRATVVEKEHIWYQDDGSLTLRLCEEQPDGSGRPRYAGGRGNADGRREERRREEGRDYDRRREEGRRDYERRREEGRRDDDRSTRRGSHVAVTNGGERSRQEHSSSHSNHHRDRHSSRQQSWLPSRQQSRQQSRQPSQKESPEWIDPLEMFRRHNSRHEAKTSQHTVDGDDDDGDRRRNHAEDGARRQEDAERRRQEEAERRRQEEAERRRPEQSGNNRERETDDRHRQGEETANLARERAEQERRRIDEEVRRKETARRKEEEERRRVEERRREEDRREEQRKRQEERRKLEAKRREIEEERRRREEEIERRREQVERSESERSSSSSSSSSSVSGTAEQLMEQKRVCTQPALVGLCRAHMIRYAFNAERVACEQFVYGGCGGNENNFETREACRAGCGLIIDMMSGGGGAEAESETELTPEDIASLKEICTAPLETGPCRAAINKFGFNAEKGMCVPFIYGGCMGNDNNFDGVEKCQDKCGVIAEMMRAGSDVPEDRSSMTFGDRDRICHLESDSGPCFAAFQSWFFNPDKLMCEEFVYGGCVGNENRFSSRAECTDTCNPVRQNLIDAASVRDPTRHQPAPTLDLMEAKRVCMMPQDPGACLASDHSFAFNLEKLMCVPFVYGGCGGNENRFASEDDCLRKCKPLQDMLRGALSEEENSLPVVSSGDLFVSPRGGMPLEERKRICMQPNEAGSCYASIPRFGYHPMKAMCVPFFYGGCEGNENNFETEDECLDVCGPLRDMTGGGGGGAPAEADAEADRRLAESKRVCMQPQKTGRCRANMPRFAFNVEKQMCVPFTYGGCGANDNNFMTEELCQGTCLPFQKMLMNGGGGGEEVAPPRRRGKKPRKNKDKHFGASGAQSHVNRISPGPPCCACGEAKYRIVFKGIWSPETHPKDFPKQLFLTHWSDLIGGSHSRRFRIYEHGGYASEGLRWVAEFGSNFNLEKEIKQFPAEVRDVVKTRGLWHPKVQEATSATFSVNSSHHLFSFVSMLGPSPDWFVGLDSLNLCTADCNWMSGAKFEMRPNDAGTDSGVSYMSANAATKPRERIRPIASSDPGNPRQPFFDPSGKPIPSLANVYIVRENVDGDQCGRAEETQPDVDSWNVEEDAKVLLGVAGGGSGGGGEDGGSGSQKLDASHPKCAVGPWTPWSPCSVTCGAGLRMRSRSLSMDGVPPSMCAVQLQENELCDSPNGECDPNDPCAITGWGEWTACSSSCGFGTESRTRRYNDKGRAMAANCQQILTETRECDSICGELYDARCMVTDWSDWSDCSATCGPGLRMRTRKYAKEGMLDISMCKEMLVEKQDCVAVDCGAGGSASSSSSEFCLTTPLGDWSECSATRCGDEGVMAREMMFVNKQKALMMNCDMSVLKLMKACAKDGCEDDGDGGNGGNGAIDESLVVAKRVCMAPAVTGRCRARIDRFAFDVDKLMCVPFVYGGCGGNDNNFLSEEKCMELCKPLRDMILASNGGGDDDDDDDDDEDELESELSRINSIIGPALPLIGESASGKRLKTYKALDKFDFEDKRTFGARVGGGVRRPLSPNSEGDEGVPDKPIVQAEDPNLPIRRDAGEVEAEEAARLEESAKHAKDVVEDKPNSNASKKNEKKKKKKVKSPVKKVKTPVDCVVSEWGEWSPCGGSCGKNGRKIRTKTILTPASRGGVRCPKKKALRERRKCVVAECQRDDDSTAVASSKRDDGGAVDCVLGEWSQWSACSRSCGGGVARRTRKKLAKPKRGGAPCGALKQKRECNPEACGRETY